MAYRHTQFGYTAPIVLVFFAALMVLIGVLTDDSAAVLISTGLLFLVLGATAVNFNRLTARVEEGELVASFGWGWPVRTIDATEIESIRQVRTRWFYGWGIRMIPRGWMYNVWGLDAVELELTSGKVFRIGTDEPAELHAAVEQLIASHGSNGSTVQI